MFVPPMLVFGIAYFAMAAGLFALACRRCLTRREGRFPVPDDIRLRRRAGETLSNDLIRLGEKFDHDAFLYFGLPLLAFLLPVWLVGQVSSAKHLGVLVACVTLFLAALLYGGRRLLKTSREMRNKRLALFGERVAGDQLMELVEDGYAVFHDVPCHGGGGSFNLDHVVVGNGAVTVVETKTYRKPCGKTEGHKVTYDGNQLHWPGWSSSEELEQVTAGALWLQTELRKKLNVHVPVRAALTVPGWYVIGGPPMAPVLVENVKRLPRFIRERFVGTLGTGEEKLIRNHLRSMCETICFHSMAA